jgi:hypothetical protein
MGGRHLAWLGATGTGGVQTAPGRIKAFKLSNGALFADELRDIVGLYVDRPADAGLPLRTQPGLPKKKGRLGNVRHDCERNGTTTFVRHPRPA